MYPRSSSVSRHRRAVAAGMAALRAISLRVGAGCSRVKARMTAIPLASPPIASRRLGGSLRAAMDRESISVCERTEEGCAPQKGGTGFGLDGRGAAGKDDSYNEQLFAIR